jgi:hypothetical protein
MPKHEQQQTAVACLVAGTLDGSYELIDFGRNQVFAVAHRFVQCCKYKKPRNASNGAGWVF